MNKNSKKPKLSHISKSPRGKELAASSPQRKENACIIISNLTANMFKQEEALWVIPFWLHNTYQSVKWP